MRISRRALLLLPACVSCRGQSEASVIAELHRLFLEQGLGLVKPHAVEMAFFPFDGEGLSLVGSVDLMPGEFQLYRVAKDGRSFTCYPSPEGLFWSRYSLDGSPPEIYRKAPQIGYNIEFARDNERALYQDKGKFDRVAPNGTRMGPERIWAGNARTGEFFLLGQDYSGDGMLRAQTSWGPDNERFVACLDGEIRLYTYGTWTFRVLAHGKEPRWSPDGRWIVYLGPDGRLKMGEMKDPAAFQERDLGIEAPRGVAWSPDSRFFLYATKRIHLKRVMGIYSLAVYRVSDGATAAISAPLYDNWTNEKYGWAYLPEKLRRTRAQSR
ncbi:MAG: PD40 domain-containing protein [Bryobacteraceae bacterium]|nr:PD40 domain-containing protein [Bryobacteraceae bacterium]